MLEDFGSFVLFETGFAIHDGTALEQTVWREASVVDEPYARWNLLLYFEHNDVDAAFANIAPHVDLVHPVERQAWGQRMFRFYPDRHAVEVGEPQTLTVPENSRFIQSQKSRKIWEFRDIAATSAFGATRTLNRAIGVKASKIC